MCFQNLQLSTPKLIAAEYHRDCLCQRAGPEGVRKVMGFSAWQTKPLDSYQNLPLPGPCQANVAGSEVPTLSRTEESLPLRNYAFPTQHVEISLQL